MFEYPFPMLFPQVRHDLGVAARGEVMADVDICTVAELMGHKKIQMPPVPVMEPERKSPRPVSRLCKADR